MLASKLCVSRGNLCAEEVPGVGMIEFQWFEASRGLERMGTKLKLLLALLQRKRITLTDVGAERAWSLMSKIEQT